MRKSGNPTNKTCFTQSFRRTWAQNLRARSELLLIVNYSERLFQSRTCRDLSVVMQGGRILWDGQLLNMFFLYLEARRTKQPSMMYGKAIHGLRGGANMGTPHSNVTELLHSSTECAGQLWCLRSASSCFRDFSYWVERHEDFHAVKQSGNPYAQFQGQDSLAFAFAIRFLKALAAHKSRCCMCCQMHPNSDL